MKKNLTTFILAVFFVQVSAQAATGPTHTVAHAGESRSTVDIKTGAHVVAGQPTATVIRAEVAKKLEAKAAPDAQAPLEIKALTKPETEAMQAAVVEIAKLEIKSVADAKSVLKKITDLDPRNSLAVGDELVHAFFISLKNGMGEILKRPASELNALQDAVAEGLSRFENLKLGEIALANQTFAELKSKSLSLAETSHAWKEAALSGRAHAKLFIVGDGLVTSNIQRLIDLEPSNAELRALVEAKLWLADKSPKMRALSAVFDGTSRTDAEISQHLIALAGKPVDASVAKADRPLRSVFVDLLRHRERLDKLEKISDAELSALNREVSTHDFRINEESGKLEISKLNLMQRLWRAISHFPRQWIASAREWMTDQKVIAAISKPSESNSKDETVAVKPEAKVANADKKTDKPEAKAKPAEAAKVEVRVVIESDLLKDIAPSLYKAQADSLTTVHDLIDLLKAPYANPNFKPIIKEAAAKSVKVADALEARAKYILGRALNLAHESGDKTKLNLIRVISETGKIEGLDLTPSLFRGLEKATLELSRLSPSLTSSELSTLVKLEPIASSRQPVMISLRLAAGERVMNKGEFADHLARLISGSELKEQLSRQSSASSEKTRRDAVVTLGLLLQDTIENGSSLSAKVAAEVEKPLAEAGFRVARQAHSLTIGTQTLASRVRSRVLGLIGR
jgi:hypothetical protein